MGIFEKIKLKFGLFPKKRVNKSQVIPFRILKRDNYFYLLYKNLKTTGTYNVITKSQDGFSFQAVDKEIKSPNIPADLPNSFLVSGYSYRKQKIMYFGNRSINIAYSKNNRTWQPSFKPVLVTSHPIEVAGAFSRENYLMVLFYEKKVEEGIICHSAHLAFIDKKNPHKLIWRTDKPIWQQKDLWPKQRISSLGSIMIKDKLICYWLVDDNKMFGVIISGFKYDPHAVAKGTKLYKYAKNPIISPKIGNSWEDFNTFNPAALYVNGDVHLFYRAQGYDYISTVGYAVSHDGRHIHKRSTSPVFVPKMDFENNTLGIVNSDFVSAGGWGGCEDPRVTQIDGRVYMTYVAFDGQTPPRLAMSSILLTDFLKERWNWAKPVLISPPGVIDKSGCLLPQKINGKYVFFHRVFPNILIDYIDDLNFDGKTKWLKGQYQIKIRPDKWDSRKIGAGAPPIKTRYGWLLIYYGVDDRNDSQYQIGAMLLDLKDPTKVLYRSDQPILQPTEDYENSGFKPGIAYPCGAVIVKSELLVYYGAADSYVCVASANLNNFLKELMANKPIHLHDIKVREVVY